ncbi:S1 RNA-binding domain-containing protein [Streptomyces sp. NPDC001530]|uniref:S1 RNA-binding domain-containing protein n=1 Tax=Streptomyces sp. NPDC001530 TaxID=3364582 RepID=UPI00368125BE
MIGQTVSGQVTKVAPIGAFVRVADCVEGLIRPEELPETPAVEGQALMVTILGVDLERHRIFLAAARGR